MDRMPNVLYLDTSGLSSVELFGTATRDAVAFPAVETRVLSSSVMADAVRWETLARCAVDGGSWAFMPVD